MLLFKLTKSELYAACQEEGYVMPNYNSTACRVQYIVNVRSGNEYCPKVDEVQIDL
jgi:hypothetical protein